MRRSINSILMIAYRDLLKFLKDRARIVATLIFPIFFIVILGGSSQGSYGDKLEFNILYFTFTGVLAQTLFQSSASGVISLIEDRENDFSQEMFISPVSRYSILFGKIFGESVVAMVQLIGIFIIALIIGININWTNMLFAFPVMLLACIFGASFGVLVLSNLSSQRAANQVFPFLVLPQLFLAGVFTPMKNVPIYLEVLSRISPMTYIVDLMRAVIYNGNPEYNAVVIFPVWLSFSVVVVLTVLFIFLGTYFFVKNERNK